MPFCDRAFLKKKLNFMYNFFWDTRYGPSCFYLNLFDLRSYAQYVVVLFMNNYFKQLKWKKALLMNFVSQISKVSHKSQTSNSNTFMDFSIMSEINTFSRNLPRSLNKLESSTKLN